MSSSWRIAYIFMIECMLDIFWFSINTATIRKLRVNQFKIFILTGIFLCNSVSNFLKNRLHIYFIHKLKYTINYSIYWQFFRQLKISPHKHIYLKTHTFPNLVLKKVSILLPQSVQFKLTIRLQLAEIGLRLNCRIKKLCLVNFGHFLVKFLLHFSWTLIWQ